LAVKKGEVSRRMEEIPLDRLVDQLPEVGGPSFLAAVRRPGVNIIAEIKYKSPSHGAFLCQDPPVEIAAGYAESGAAAISVLTDETFFDGKLEYLQQVSEYFQSGESSEGEEEGERRLRVPLLRKDFIVDRYQIAEAAIAGASACLLIVAGLNSRALSELQEAGRDYGVESLVEIHDSYELETAVDSGTALIGVNNRDLRSFEVNVNTSFEIARRLEGESHFELIAESGISDPSLIAELRDAGFGGFLIGTAFMDSRVPSQRLRELLVAE